MMLESFDTSDAPPYAILSHTWENDEVTFTDFHDPDVRCTKQGWSKIKKTCSLAQHRGRNYAWVDSCCIDKDSSAELSEAINSMFVWYGLASECYAYLSDYEAPEQQGDAVVIDSCRWFTRGWTLQELIAPSCMTFYDKSWTPVGTKIDLSSQIAQVTKIDEEVLTNKKFEYLRGILDSRTVAMRMSWAATRTTKRPEDMAYCLLGIFGISTPMLYGEGGERAFMRLQEEIIRESNDMSIFAWKQVPSDVIILHTTTGKTTKKPRGILASSPREFLGAHYQMIEQRNTPEYTMTNKGLRIETGLLPSSGERRILKLDCYMASQGKNRLPLGIYVEKQGDGTYARVQPESLAQTWQMEFPMETVYIARRSLNTSWARQEVALRVNLQFIYETDNGKFTHQVIDRAPQSLWDAENGVFKTTPSQQDFICFERVAWKHEDGGSNEFAVVAGIRPSTDNSANMIPWAYLASSKKMPPIYEQIQRKNIEWLAHSGPKPEESRLTLRAKWSSSLTASLRREYRRTLEGGGIRILHTIYISIK